MQVGTIVELSTVFIKPSVTTYVIALHTIALFSTAAKQFDRVFFGKLKVFLVNISEAGV